jgi:hypothetical protein
MNVVNFRQEQRRNATQEQTLLGYYELQNSWPEGRRTKALRTPILLSTYCGRIYDARSLTQHRRL